MEVHDRLHQEVVADYNDQDDERDGGPLHSVQIDDLVKACELIISEFVAALFHRNSRVKSVKILPFF